MRNPATSPSGRYHGLPASGYSNSTQIKHDLTTTIAGALVLVLVFLLLCFRRWNFIPLLLLPVVFGTLFGLTMMYWLKGEFSLLALGIGGVVLGVALNYVLHVMTHHRYVNDPVQLLRDQVLVELKGFEGLARVAARLVQFGEDVVDGLQAEVLLHEVVGLDFRNEFLVSDELFDLHVQ